MFYPIRDQSRETEKLTVDELQEYFRLKFAVTRINWETYEKTEKDYPARVCQEKDFTIGQSGDTLEKSKWTFQSWKQVLIMCPDVPEGESVVLKGDLSLMESVRFTF